MKKSGIILYIVLYAICCVITTWLTIDLFQESKVLGLLVSIIGIVMLCKIWARRPSLNFVDTKENNKMMDRDYFDQITKVVDDLMTVYNSALSSPEFEDAIDRGFPVHIDGKILNDKQSKIQYLFWLDMAHCGKGLGFGYDRHDKTSFGIYYFIERTIIGERLSYDNYSKLYRPTNRTLVENVL